MTTETKLPNPTVKPGLRAAINAPCKSCIPDPKAGGGSWRQQVGACTITRCALWPVRPTSSAPKVMPEDGPANIVGKVSDGPFPAPLLG